MYKLDLHMFDGGAAAGGAPAAGSTAQAGGTAMQTEGTQSGEQEGEQSNQLTPEEQRKADYKKFKEQYKDLYGEDVKKQVDRRFAPMNRMQQQLDSQGRLMQVIAGCIRCRRHDQCNQCRQRLLRRKGSGSRHAGGKV